MNKKIIHSGISTLLLVLLFSGCTKEDLSACFPGIKLSFTYIKNTESENNMHGSVDNISVYLFDSNGKYVRVFRESVANLATTNYEMFIPVDIAGDYEIVTLGDVSSEHYTIYIEDEAVRATRSDIDNFGLEVIHNNNIIDRELGNFFISKAQKITTENSNHKTNKVDLIKNNKLIRFTITGLDGMSDYMPVVRAENGLYNSENNTPVTAQEITYKPYNKDSQTGKYLTTTLRIVETVAMPLTIEDEIGNNLLPSMKYNLVELIKFNSKYDTQESLDREDIFDIHLDFRNDVMISVTINNWKHVFVIPEL